MILWLKLLIIIIILKRNVSYLNIYYIEQFEIESFFCFENIKIYNSYYRVFNFSRTINILF